MELVAGLLLGAKGMFLYWLYREHAASEARITAIEARLDRQHRPTTPQPPQRPQEEKY